MSWIDVVVAGAKLLTGGKDKGQQSKQAFVPMFSADSLDDDSAEAVAALKETAALGENTRETQYYNTINGVLDNYKQTEGEPAFKKLLDDLDTVMRA